METNTEAKTTSITFHHSINQKMSKVLRSGQNPRLQSYYQKKRRREGRIKEIKTRVMKKIKMNRKRRQRQGCITLVVRMK